MSTEDMIEALHDSDAREEMSALCESVNALDSVEEPDDFRGELKEAIARAEALLSALRDLQESTAKGSAP